MDLPKLASPARRALASAGIVKLEDLQAISRQALAELHGMGPNALGVLENACASAGIIIGEKIEKNRLA